MSRYRYVNGYWLVMLFAFVALVAFAKPEPDWVESEVDPRVNVRYATALVLDSGYAGSVREQAENGGCLTMERKEGSQWYLGKPYPPMEYQRLGQDGTLLKCPWGTVMWHTHWSDTVYVVDTLGNRLGVDGLVANKCLPSWSRATSDLPQILSNARVVAGLIVCGPRQYMLYGEKL